MALTPFDYTKSIDSKSEQLDISDYNAFIVNRALSFGVDTCLFANEMNINSSIPNNWQYDFLYYGIPKKKRYNKWIKFDAIDNIDIIQEYYNCSFQKAIEYSKILTEEEIEILKTRLNKGGKGK
jgi:hypothetical protein